MLRCQDVSIDKSLIRVHPIKDRHSTAVVEDREVRDQRGWELVEQACHGIVGKERRLCNLLLPLTIAGSVLLVGEDTLPFRRTIHLGHLSLHEVCSLLLQSLVRRDVDDIAQLIL